MRDKGKYELIWTIAWFIFISILCFIFKNGYPLFLLFVWILGFDFDTSILCSAEANFEVIEENKEIEKLHILDEGNSNEALYKYCSKIVIKQNELVRAVNKINKEREEK